MPKIPDPPPTPPRGGARVKPMTEHQMIDVGELAKRAADIGLENKADLREIKPLVAEIPEMKMMLRLALKPTITPSYVRFATVAAAAAMLVSSIALVAIVVLLAHSTPASASTLPTSAQASNRVQVP